MIQRDGYTTSLWQAATAPYQTESKANAGVVYDVIIVGGGITGVTTALLLQEAGRQCLLLEGRNLCFGTTGGTTAHLNTLLEISYALIEKNFSRETARLVAQATADAIGLIASNSEKYAINCDFEKADAFLFAQDEEQEKELEDIYEAAIRAGLAVEYTAHLPGQFGYTKAIKAGGQAKCNPTRYVYGMARAFEKMGGAILQDCRVTGLKNEEPLLVETSCGLFRANDIIYATHIPPGVNLLHLRCAPLRSYVMAALLQDDNYPADLIYDMEKPYHYYRSQTINLQPYLVAGGKDHKTGHVANTDYLFTRLEATLREHFRIKQIAFRWSSQYFESADGLPYIGHLPAHPHHIFTATGYGGNGITYSQVAAILLRDILLNRDNPAIEVFNPNRIKPIAGFTHFVTHNAEVVSNFAGKIFSGEKLEALAGLAPGEAGIVNYENEKIGLYKDERNNLHAVQPSCTHLKCEVSWNSAEHSWDCPCHGARYDSRGNVLTGPADHPLQPIDLPVLEVTRHNQQ